MSNVILRPVFNRPEMLYLSFEYEKAAREYYEVDDEAFTTIFLIEYGTTKEVMRLVKTYPYKKKLITRDKKYGLTINILEGMKEAFGYAEDYLIHLEDDVLLHETYFEYMDKLLNHKDVGDFSVLSPYNKNDNGDVNEVRKAHHYSALAPLISKDFHIDFIKPCSTTDYYSDKPGFAIRLNNAYRNHWGKGYKYTDTTHYQQAGIINRLVDIAMIETGAYVYQPRVNRQQHIGFYGYNRNLGKKISGDSFEFRVENLRNIIKDPKKMYSMTGSPEYNDYATFSPKLNDWDGILVIKG